MGIPDGSFGLAALIVIAVPGFIQAAVRRWAQGELAQDRDIGLSIARGVAFAVALTGIYVLILGNRLFGGLVIGADADTFAVINTRVVALSVVALYIAVPAFLAVFINRQHISWVSTRRAPWLRLPHSKHGYTSVPGAWDHAVRQNQQAWIKVLRANGQWVGGWFTKGSSASAYPEPRTLYIDQQWVMTANGRFVRPATNSRVYLTITDQDLVIWIADPRTEKESENPL